jgi:hypothetical protein
LRPATPATPPNIDPGQGTAVITFFVVNSTTPESAFRIPWIGYLGGSPIKSLASAKAGPKTAQIFNWSEIIAY